MQLIDAKFKDNTPEATVENIQALLQKLGITFEEEWPESGLDYCHSVHVQRTGTLPGYNGKGVTKAFARASAYAEMIERLQSGIYLSSFQSIHRDPAMNFHMNAPDKKFMTEEELIRDGEWMDHIIRSYGNPMITRQTIAQYCTAFACADNGQILTIPYYSLFEDKYVYIPAGFIDRMYSSNGICAGNTREEAWVHGLSEIMERYASQKMLVSGEPAPRISEEILKTFPTVWHILQQIREHGQFDIAVFDYSIGNGFPVVSSRIIDKKRHNYHINVAADPVLEIAVQRTLTELFQGRSMDNLRSSHNGKILNKVTDYPITSNITNQLYTSDGLYTARYFADELTCDRVCAQFPDNSNKTNKELLQYMLGLFRDMGRPVYVRNYSYLGFHSYQFIVPGFSEKNGLRLAEIIPDYALRDSIQPFYRNVASATEADLQWLLNYSNTTKTIFAKYNGFASNAGIPMTGLAASTLSHITRAYAAYRLGQLTDAIDYLKPLVDSNTVPEESRCYFQCINQYLTMKQDGIEDKLIRSILYKFFEAQYPDKLYALLAQDATPYDDYILRCDTKSCDSCRYRTDCHYHSMKELTATIGEVYQTFTEGQSREVFATDML